MPTALLSPYFPLPCPPILLAYASAKPHRFPQKSFKHRPFSKLETPRNHRASLRAQQTLEFRFTHASVAQLDSASVFGTEGCWFESSRAYLSHPANFRLPASSQIERFSLVVTRSLKSPVFWAFSIFRPQLAALSLFLPRSDFPNVASVKTEFSTANYRAL